MPEAIYIIGQIFGGIAILCGFLTYQMKTQKQILLMLVATSSVFCLHYLMIGAISGMAMNIIGVLRGLLYYYRNEKGWKSPVIPVTCTALMAVIGVISWEAWYSVFVFLGLVIHTWCTSRDNPQFVRASILVTSPLVLLYDVFARSIGGTIYEAVAIASATIGIVRYRKIQNGGAD